jgi:hypothetical protein
MNTINLSVVTLEADLNTQPLELVVEDYLYYLIPTVHWVSVPYEAQCQVLKALDHSQTDSTWSIYRELVARVNSVA